MEKLIEKWGWKYKIEKKLQQKLAEIGADIHCKTFLADVDMKECSTSLLDCIKVGMCNGGSLVPLPDIERYICRAIVNLSKNAFLRSLSCDRKKVTNIYFYLHIYSFVYL